MAGANLLSNPSDIWSGLPFSLTLMLILTFHEFGHFYVAKANKVKVDRFSIGFGKPVVKFRDSKNTIWHTGHRRTQF